MAIHYYQEVIKMSLSISDARVFSAALKKARQKRKLTQAECAELLDHSVSFQKDLERGRCSPSIEGFYHICRMLDISADDCIFQDGADRTGSTYQALLWLLQLSLQAWIRMPCPKYSPWITPADKRSISEKQKSQPSRSYYLFRWLFCDVAWKDCPMIVLKC